ncbi:MAG: hypothetical protein HQ503_12085 [Rhodospirillales bacterium]|nr:hypothetical protein [Rhodospirillales bacterium]
MFGLLKKKPIKSKRRKPKPRLASVDGVDLDSGTITIDDSGPDITVTTGEVFRQAGDGDAPPAGTKAGGGKVFIIDLKPILNAMGVKAGSKSALGLFRFCETILARTVVGKGTYNNQGNDLFFFQMNMENEDALRAGIGVVNELGGQFLRDGFKPEDLIPLMVDAINADEAFGDDGLIDPDKALGAQTKRRLATEEKARTRAAQILDTDELVFEDERPEEDLLYEVEIESPDPDSEWVLKVQPGRPASQRVKRGPKRRKIKMERPDGGLDRRHRRHGRRQGDDPRFQSW